MTTPSTSAQVLNAADRMRELMEGARLGFAVVPVAHIAEWRKLISDLASPSPAASPASPSGVRVKPLEWREVNPDCHLAATPFGSIRVYRDGTWYGQWSTEGDEQSADFGAAKAAAQADYEARILSALASEATPAPTSGSENGGELSRQLRDRARGAEEECRTDDADLMLAAAKSIERMDDAASEANALYLKMSAERDALKGALEGAKRRFNDIAAGAAFQPSIHAGAGVIEIDAALAKPASEPAGGDVAAQALAMLDAESDDKLKTLWGVAAKSFASRIRALSSSAGPAVEAVAWAVDIPGFGPAFFRDRGDAEEQCRAPDCEGSVMRALVYAHPAPATAESEALSVIEAARCIRHWHDREPDGMVVSAEHVRALWSALERYDAALAPATEGRKG